jgi:hypothetical protein
MAPRKKTPADYRALAQRRGFRWLGPEVPNTLTKTIWECEQGHKWEARYQDIRSGKGCPTCAGNTPKTPADYAVLATQRGFRWLGPAVSNVQTKTGWECQQRHKWKACYSSIQQGTGCPICACKARKTPLDFQALAERRGFRWLGPEVRNHGTRTTWQCEQGHRWQARYKDIQRGKGCPTCAGVVPKTPDDYSALAEQRGFRWLGPEVPNNQTKTVWQCQEGHRWEACYGSVQQGRGCPVCAGLIPKAPADYVTLARERGLRWLGPEVPSTRTKTTWQCAQGHQWEARYGSIQQGQGCPVCAGVAPKTSAEYHALAEQRGFRWLGPEVPNCHTKTTWQCEKGHKWEAEFNSIQAGTGCPICIDMVNGARVSQVQRSMAEMLGGVLNCEVGSYRIDAALHISGVQIAVEYDSWYWHAHKRDHDARRDEKLIAAGWHILHIRSNLSLPTQEQLDWAIAQCLAGQVRVDIILDDWGKGQTRFGTG